jgi:hypothetical protein
MVFTGIDGMVSIPGASVFFFSSPAFGMRCGDSTGALYVVLPVQPQSPQHEFRWNRRLNNPRGSLSQPQLVV